MKSKIIAILLIGLIPGSLFLGCAQVEPEESPVPWSRPAGREESLGWADRVASRYTLACYFPVPAYRNGAADFFKHHRARSPSTSLMSGARSTRRKDVRGGTRLRCASATTPRQAGPGTFVSTSRIRSQASPNFSQTFYYDRVCHYVSKPSLARRPQRVRTRCHPPACREALIRSPGAPGQSRKEVCEMSGLAALMNNAV